MSGNRSYFLLYRKLTPKNTSFFQLAFLWGDDGEAGFGIGENILESSLKNHLRET